MRASRRQMLTGVSGLVVLGVVGSPGWARSGATASLPQKASQIPLEAIELAPSLFRKSFEINEKFLLQLEPDRMLHNYRKYAGLEPKGEIYGGWESDTISGELLGHYLTAICLAYRQNGSAELKRRAGYIVTELAEVQAARGNGYVGGIGRKLAGGTIVDGETIFTEISKGDIRSGGFDLNGSWSPLYNIHKVFAGLLDVHATHADPVALKIVVGMAGYFERVFEPLTDAQMQTVLGCEYGGLNESFAELYSRTGDRRWLGLANRIYDRRVLDPLKAGEDKLANFHANTQIPKLIGLARIFEVSGDQSSMDAASYFWDLVTTHHSYVIGGNSHNEYFFEPDAIANHIAETTCEHCNTYNMLKLTNKMFTHGPDGRYFDYYERAHLNHVMAAQNINTGGFTYMTPMFSGATRGYSTPGDDSFWCCVCSGMESHAKHGDSAFWEGEDVFIVNLYMPATVNWQQKAATFTLATDYPSSGTATLTLDKLTGGRRFSVALRIPSWAGQGAVITVNGKPAQASFDKGYAIVYRRWSVGDTLEITLPMPLREEKALGGKPTVAFLRGPLVLAADLGSASDPYDGFAPAMVGANLLAAFNPKDQAGHFSVTGVVRPRDLDFVPFFSQYDRRSAVYFQVFSDAEWREEEEAFIAEQKRIKELADRSVDVMYLGQMQPERDHDFQSKDSWPVTYRLRNGRNAYAGGFFEFKMKVRPGPLQLVVTYWGDEDRREFDILVDGKLLATQTLRHDKPVFFDVYYDIPEEMTKGKDKVLVRFQPKGASMAGPAYGALIIEKDRVSTD